ncbi:hypothetical protein Lal_00032148 [Lupinus albus]|nr:hypothetical protein Lal_00032148 [Lupinus albus]
MIGAFAHGAIFFIRDYNPQHNVDNILARMLDHKEAIISHLSLASIFLGFHTLGLYVHNDVMLAFGTREKQILIEPYFPNGYNLLMVKLPMGSVYFYIQRLVRPSLRGEENLGNTARFPLEREEPRPSESKLREKREEGDFESKNSWESSRSLRRAMYELPCGNGYSCEEDLAPDLGTILMKTPISQKEERKKTDKDYRR